MPEQDTSQIDETQIPAKMLFRILPEEAINEVAKSLLKDIAQSSPPMFMQGGEELYTHGDADVGFPDNYESAQVKTSVAIGKDAVDTIIYGMIDDDQKEALISVGYAEEDIVNQVGLFILSNVNGMSDLHNFAVDLFREIGALAYYKGEGEIETSVIGMYIYETIDAYLEKVKSIKEKFYWQGVKKHFDALLKSNKIGDVKRVIETFNDIIGENRRITVEDSVDISYEQQVVDDVIEYLANPTKYLRDNPDMVINLTAYENEHGKLPRQPELPGLEQEYFTTTGGVL